MWRRAPGSRVLGTWLCSEKEAGGVHKSVQLHFLDQEHNEIWLSGKDIKEFACGNISKVNNEMRCAYCVVYTGL